MHRAAVTLLEKEKQCSAVDSETRRDETKQMCARVLDNESWNQLFSGPQGKQERSRR